MSPSSRKSARSPSATARWCWSTIAMRRAIWAMQGKGTPALTGAGGRVDIVTGTFGKTLGGAMGGFVAAAQPIVDLLRQRARPYLFSNSLAPPVVAGSLKALEIAIRADDLRAKLGWACAALPRRAAQRPASRCSTARRRSFPVMLGDARVAQQMAAALDRLRRLCRRLLLPRRAARPARASARRCRRR